MTEYMLITLHPLFSSKSFHKTIDSVYDKIEDVLKLTERYYELQGKEFELRQNYFTGEYPGILLYKIFPDNPHIMRLVGKAKPYKKPEELDGMDSSGGQNTGTGQESADTVLSGD